MARPDTEEAGTTTAPGDLDEITLVVRATEGDLAAFEVLVARYQRRIFQLALRMMGNSADAEDVVQDVFVAAWRRLPQLREEAAFAGWLYRATTNRCLTLLRRVRPQAPLDEQLPTPDPLDDPQRAAQVSAEFAALAAALQRLPPAQRAVWLLREVHDRSYGEIAQIVGGSPHAVRGRLSRARVQLAELMSPWR